MFWMLPQSLKGSLSLPSSSFGVLLLGTLLVSVVLAALIFVIALPSRSESFVVAAWSVQSGYVLAACIGVWRCSKNAAAAFARVAGRLASVLFGSAQLFLLGQVYYLW